MADFTFYGGIYREAELILTERTAISPLYLGSDGVLVHPQTVGPEKVEGEIAVPLLPGVFRHVRVPT